MRATFPSAELPRGEGFRLRLSWRAVKHEGPLRGWPLVLSGAVSCPYVATHQRSNPAVVNESTRIRPSLRWVPLMPFEEDGLRRAYGNQYVGYSRRVRRLVPFVY